MPTLDQQAANPFIKIMLIGDSGSGKTGALLSLVQAGYKIGILDMDDGLTPLVQLIKRADPKLLSNVSAMSFRDKYKGSATGMSLVGTPTAYLNAAKTMDKWEDDTKPGEWGPDHIYVVDSFTLLCKAAFSQAEFLKPASNSGRQADGRQIYGAAQTAAENFLACLMGPEFKTNVIVISHIADIELADGTRKGFPASIGQALSRHIAKYLNDLFVVEAKGTGENVRRIIRTVPNAMTDAKTSLLDLPKELPIDTGLATIFSKLKAM